VAFFTAMEDAAKAYAADNPGVDISYFSCKTPADVACQTAQIEDAVAKGFQAIVITPMGPEVIPAMDAAADKGVKVVLADNNLEEFKNKTAVAATDNVKGGQAAGAYLKSELKSGDTIGLMEGVRGVPALDARIQGVKDALDGTGVTVILGGADTKCDSAQGATVAEDLLTREPNLTAIYSACDDPAIAAAKVVKDKGKTVLVMGYDGLPDAATAIMAGDMKATIAQFPGKMASLGVEAAVKAVRGEQVEPFIDTGTELVTSDNASQFLEFQ
jgi:ABC-type sugar transport system substrate-binding protein